jgi:hypothetical protein
MDGKTIATRNIAVTEYNDNVIYSLRLNQLMNDCGKLITEALKDKSISEAYRLIARDQYQRNGE